MKELAPDVWQLGGLPPNGINVYVIGDVLIDAATRRAGRRILKQVEGHEISLHALTHVHPDHQGASAEVCETLGVPLACHADDVDAMEGRRPVQEVAPGHPMNRITRRSGRARRTRSTACWTRATRSRGFASSTPRATSAAR